MSVPDDASIVEVILIYFVGQEFVWKYLCNAKEKIEFVITNHNTVHVAPVNFLGTLI